MLDSLFHGIFDSASAQTITVGTFLLCVLFSLVIGLVLTAAAMYRSRSTRSFALTLTLLPAVVCVVIMVVNGNIGTAVAVAGAFSLVRFRSMPGTAKEIVMLFTAMAAGIVAGMGYLGYALLFTLIVAAFTMLASSLEPRLEQRTALYRTLRITVPEDLDYTGIFDDLLHQYASAWTLTQVKTTNLGSLFRLTYNITLRRDANEKALLDALRTRNGNLEIAVSPQDTVTNEL